MTPLGFYIQLQNAKSSPFTLPSIPIALGESDFMAARLLIWLFEQMPNATQGDLEDVLDSAKWWTLFWASAYTADTAPPHPTGVVRP